MIRSISATNFSSIRDPLTLDFEVAKNVPHSESQFADPFGTGERIPRVLAFFGPNAAGKSTVLRVLSFISWFVRKSIDLETDDVLPIFPFYDDERLKAPITFKLEFSSDMIESEADILFRYELELTRFESDYAITREALYYRPDRHYRRIFERNGTTIISSPLFKLPKNDARRDVLRSNASTTSALAKFGHEPSTLIISAFIKIFTNILNFDKKVPSEDFLNTWYKNYDKHLVDLNKFIACVDLGIESVNLRNDKDTLEPIFKHRGLDLPIPLFMESQGTRHMYKFFPLINLALRNGGIAVIDELDSDIHPFVVSEIIRMFRDPAVNPNNAQLIFSCHNTAVLDGLSKEEAYVVEKDRSGRTTAYGFRDVKGLRRDGNLGAKYLGGFIGGLPTLG